MLGYALNHRRKYLLRYLGTLASKYPSQHFSRRHLTVQYSFVHKAHMMGYVTQSHASTTSKEITGQDKVPVIGTARGMLARMYKPL